MGIKDLRKALVDAYAPGASQPRLQIEGVAVLVEDLMTRLHTVRRPGLTPEVLALMMLMPHVQVLAAARGRGVSVLVMDKPTLVPAEKAVEQAARREAYAAKGGKYYAPGTVLVHEGVQEPGKSPEEIDMTALMAKPYTRALIGPALIAHIEKRARHWPQGVIIADLDEDGPPRVFLTGREKCCLAADDNFLVVGDVAALRGGEGDIVADYWVKWASVRFPDLPRAILTTDADNLLLSIVQRWDAPATLADTFWIYSTVGRVSVKDLVTTLKKLRFTLNAIVFACTLMGNDYIPKTVASGGMSADTIIRRARQICVPRLGITVLDRATLERALTIFQLIEFSANTLTTEFLQSATVADVRRAVAANNLSKKVTMVPLSAMAPAQLEAHFARADWLVRYWHPSNVIGPSGVDDDA